MVSQFGEFLSKITIDYDSILLSGDFNIHVDNITGLSKIRNNSVASSAGGCDLSSSTNSTQCHIPITLFNFALIERSELQEVVKHLRSATWALDQMLSTFFKNVFSCLVENVLDIVNASLLFGIFPTGLKHAIITPLFKKSNLDPCVLENYRPILNLSFPGKILEEFAYQQLHMYLSYNNLFDAYQSGFRVNHSREIALVRVVNDLKISSDNHKVSILVLLDLSAAFETIDHAVLLQHP